MIVNSDARLCSVDVVIEVLRRRETLCNGECMLHLRHITK